MVPRQLVCGLAIASFAISHVQARHPTTIVLRNLSVIDGNGGSPLPNRTILIRAGRIAAVLMAEASPVEGDSLDLNLQGHYAIPGLVDSHVHLSLTQEDPVAALQAAFQGGVTAVRDMGGDESVLARLAERTRRDEVPESRVYFATAVRGWPSLTGVGGSRMPLVDRPAEPQWLRNVVGPSDADAIVARARQSGATGIKLYTDLPLDVLKAVAARASREGLRVWGHARIFPHRPSDGVGAGIEVLSHSSQLAFEETNGPENGEVYRLVSPDAAAIARLLRDMRARGTILEPTLLASFSSAGGRIDGSRVGRIPSLAWACRVTRRAHELGVALVAGTDRLNERNATRFPNIHTELQLLVSHGGLTPLDALTAATQTAARVLGNEDRFGTIAVGKWADLAILTADPTKDIRNTRKVAFVLKAGHVYAVRASTARGHERMVTRVRGGLARTDEKLIGNRQ